MAPTALEIPEEIPQTITKAAGFCPPNVEVIITNILARLGVVSTARA